MSDMVTEITNGIKVSVITAYQPEYSSPGQSHYVFNYRIYIENHSEYTIQLLRRHWFIYDSNGSERQVEGEGVVGQKPVIEPGDSYEYISGCNLNTEIGKMLGTYEMQRTVDENKFSVRIPAFNMIVPYRLN
ncbi:MAG TPA: Co2+/Mg2+ efflux protein ApaG [Cytophagaceae bacterium]|jgi:ApaG protein|nr:Co2+/Mg2+ efflux protein ApaG [Cytophagaceae bacterium]